MSKLQPQRIEEIFVGSLASPKCPEPDIEVEGIVLIKVRFCRDRLGMHVDEIWEMLDELPESPLPVAACRS